MNIDTMQCETCGEPMKLVPSGISRKTGKAYNAFWSCPNCKATFNPPREQKEKEDIPTPSADHEQVMKALREIYKELVDLKVYIQKQELKKVSQTTLT